MCFGLGRRLCGHSLMPTTCANCTLKLTPCFQHLGKWLTVWIESSWSWFSSQGALKRGRDQGRPLPASLPLMVLRALAGDLWQKGKLSCDTYGGLPGPCLCVTYAAVWLRCIRFRTVLCRGDLIETTSP